MSLQGTARNTLRLGGRVPLVVGALLLTTAVLSLVAAPGLALSLGASIVYYGSLVPGEVLHGQVWRLLTWAFLSGSPFSLVFDCLMLFWFGPSLVQAWGARRFAAVYAGSAIASGVIVTLVARLLHGEAANYLPFLGAEAVSCTLMICWALTYPDRVINFYFVLPIQGMRLVLITLGASALFAAFYGLTALLPEFAAEAVSLLYMFRFRLLALVRRGKRRNPSKRASHLGVWDDDKQRFRPPKWMN